MSSTKYQINSTSYYWIVILIVLSCCAANFGFNLSPNPNIVLREPQLRTAMPKMRSSYFGFTLNLKRNSVIIGAPRAQSSLEAQRKINESGAIYKCSLSGSASTCAPFVFDPWGNLNGGSNQYTYDSERKDSQWLGAAMDGSDSDNEKMVVCAPRLYIDITNHYLMHGSCYWSTNTSSTKPLNVQKIAPLRFRDKQQHVVNNERYFYYMYGEQGMSVHITENNEEILIGAPGIFTWKGSVIRHKAKPLVDLGGLSRRDEDSLTMPRQHDHREAEMVEYSSDIPNPMFWEQDDNSYFGFAVSSGYFDGPGRGKLLYVASAPQANSQQGEAYIFDIVDHYSGTEKTIKIYYTFSGEQFGEYFGYALLTEDFDNDGFVDVAIAAPYHTKGGTHENGAVYIYQNGGSSSDFTLKTVLRTEYEFSGRFGTTISKIGDINQDGFNDIAVAAPFEDDGAVYIFHGGPNGLSSKPSQRLSAPPATDLGTPISMQNMFGHGLSKGADVDGNQYLDLAIGAPNAETVYVYKAYPVVRINATISPHSQEIKTTDRSFKFSACWSMETTHPLEFTVRFHAMIKLDGQLGRATFDDKTNQYEINGTVTTDEQCVDLTAFVTFSIADIFKPIELEMAYNIVDDVPQDGQEFCPNCVAVNPTDPKSVKNKVVFSTGCKAAKCVADLSVKSSLVDVMKLPFILGSLSSLLIDYHITNKGETAYLAQIRITLPETNVAFTKTPSNCVLTEDSAESNVMVCDVNGGSPMFKGDATSIRISVDTTKLDGNELLVKGNVFSTGDELNAEDNTVENVIPLAEFSDIEISGDSSKDAISLANGLYLENLTHTFEIHNNGPSNIKSLDVLISVPMSFINPWSLQRETLIEFNSLSMRSIYNNQPLAVEWTQNNVILIMDAVETTTAQQPMIERDNFNGMQFDTSRIGLEYDMNGNDNGDSVKRRRRSIATDTANRRYSPYMQRILEEDDFGETTVAVENFSLNRLRREVATNKDAAINNLPVNRTMFFNCLNPYEEHCFQARITVLNFKAGNVPIMISLNFSIDLNKIDKILTEKRDIFVIQTAAQVKKTGSEDNSDLRIVKALPFTIISKFIETSTPLWVYFISIIFGILTLILITYILHKLGFFKRGKREELVKLKRQSEAMSYYPNPNEEDE